MRIVRREHDQHAVDARRPTQGEQRMEDQRLPGDGQVLLGQFGAEACAAAGGGDNCEMAGHGVISGRTLIVLRAST